MSNGFVPVYRVRLQPNDSVYVRFFDGMESPVQLALMLRDHQGLERAQQIGLEGAILDLDMKKEVALEIYRQIGKLAQTMGWPLPKLDEDQV